MLFLTFCIYKEASVKGLKKNILNETRHLKLILQIPISLTLVNNPWRLIRISPKLEVSKNLDFRKNGKVKQTFLLSRVIQNALEMYILKLKRPLSIK